MRGRDVVVKKFPFGEAGPEEGRWVWSGWWGGEAECRVEYRFTGAGIFGWSATATTVALNADVAGLEILNGAHLCCFSIQAVWCCPEFFQFFRTWIRFLLVVAESRCARYPC